MRRKTKTAAKGGDTRARAAANGKKVGRPKIERPPEVKDSQFAARVLGQVGKARYKKFHQARIDYETFPSRHMQWADRCKIERLYEECLEKWEQGDKGDRGAKPKAPPAPGPEPERPPHPKELVEDDEDLALIYLTCGDLGLEHRTAWGFWEKRDGKAMHTVNHLHDKPVQHEVTLSLGEGMKLAMEKAEQRVSSRKH